jgi:hypothetical protein
MQLLNTNTLDLKDFSDAEVRQTKYAILSHLWEPQNSSLREIVFHELEALSSKERQAFPKLHDLNSDTARKRREFKIGLFCDMAYTHGYQWAWIDTCCIDKRSSAELTEAINSMFRWCKQADRCYVYFNDVSWNKDNVEDEESYGRLNEGEWFKRGWTLQELLAPRSLHCYDKNWKWFGDKISLSEQFSMATGISDAHLHDQSTASVAMKLSWAAYRQTSRIEDVAYSLLGLFDINMPMLYGEGENAFQCLQRKIIKKLDDESIFGWSSAETFRPNGMLAPSPAAFADCGGVKKSADGVAVRLPYAMTDKGLELYVDVPRPLDHQHLTIVFGLNGEQRVVPKGKGKYLAIELEKFGDSWQRVNCDQACLCKHSVQTVLYVGGVKWPGRSRSSAEHSKMTAICVAQYS